MCRLRRSGRSLAQGAVGDRVRRGVSVPRRRTGPLLGRGCDVRLDPLAGDQSVGARRRRRRRGRTIPFRAKAWRGRRQSWPSDPRESTGDVAGLRRDRDVAGALVSSGEVATIALEECNRRAAGLDRQNRAARLARIEQAAAPRSAEEQGSRSEHPRRWAPVAGPVAHLANSRCAATRGSRLAFVLARASVLLRPRSALGAWSRFQVVRVAVSVSGCRVALECPPDLERNRRLA